MKTLKTIQTLSKIGKILSKIVMIFSIIGFCGCVAGLALTFFADTLTEIVGELDLGSVFDAENLSLGAIQAVLTASAIVCFGEIIVLRQAVRYFSDELAAGTPFTFDGAAALFRLGLFAVITPIATTIAASIADAIICFATVSESQLDLGNHSSVAIGIMLLILSQFCKLGAEQAESPTESSN